MISNKEKIQIIEEKIRELKEIYEANELNILNIDKITIDADYGIDVCLKIKADIELKIKALIKEKNNYL